MKVVDLIDKLFAGGLGRLEAQHAAQQGELLTFPVQLEIAGEAVVLRPAEATDRDALVAFARSLPEHDLLFLPRDITKPENVDDWLGEVAAGRYSMLVACAGANVVGSATVASDGMTWTRHVAELRLMLVPKMRGKGLGKLLTQQCFAIATNRGISKMTAHMTADQDAAIHTFEKLGFEREAVLRGQVMDREGRLHDLQILALDVTRFQAKLAAARGVTSAVGA